MLPATRRPEPRRAGSGGDESATGRKLRDSLTEPPRCSSADTVPKTISRGIKSLDPQGRGALPSQKDGAELLEDILSGYADTSTRAVTAT